MGDCKFLSKLNNPAGETTIERESKHPQLHPSAARKGKGLLVYAVQWVKNKLCASYCPLIVAVDTKDHYSVCLCNVRNGIKISWT